MQQRTESETVSVQRIGGAVELIHPTNREAWVASEDHVSLADYQ